MAVGPIPIKSLSVVLSANASGLTSTLRGAATQVTAFERQVTTSAATVGRLGTAATTATAPLTRLGAAATTTAAAMARLDAASATAAAAMGRLDGASAASAAGLARMSTGATAAATAATRLEASSTVAASSVARLDATAAGLAQVGAAATPMTRLSTATTGTATAVTRLGPASAEAAVGVERLGATAAAAAPAVATLRTASATAATALTRLSTAATVSTAAVERLGAAGVVGAAGAARLGAGAASAAAGAAQAGAASAGAAATVGRLGQAASAAGGPAGRLGQAASQGALAVSALGNSARNAATGGVLAVGVALAAAAIGAVKFQASMLNVASIDQQVAANFGAVSESVLNLSKTVPQSANTLAQGLYNIASSGFYGADAMHVLETSAVAASAGLTDTDTASKAIVASLNAYHLSASEAGRVSDALFSTVNYGVISFEALTGTVAHSVGNAARANISIEELGSALATMTLSGMSASEAGISLNNMIAKLIKPSEALSAASVKLGINLTQDLANPAIGLHGVMEKLRIASDGNVATLLRWFPEIRAARGAMALFVGDGATYSRVIGEMGDQQKTAGETARVFAVQAQSVQHQLEMLGNQIAVTGIELGMKMLPYLEQAVTGLMQFGASVKDVGGQLGGAIAPGVGALKDALGSVAQVAGNLHMGELAKDLANLGVGAVVTGFNALAAVLGTTTGFLASNTVAVEALVAAWLLFNSASIIRGIQLIAVTIASTLMNAVVAAIAAVDTLIARMTIMGAGNVWRGLAQSALYYGGTLAVVTAGVGLVVNELSRMQQAKNEIKANKVAIADILGTVTPAEVQKVTVEIEKLGTAAEKNLSQKFTEAGTKLAGMAAKAQDSLDAVNKKLTNNPLDGDFWARTFKIWENPSRDARKYEQILDDINAAQQRLAGASTTAFDTIEGNVYVLSQTLGISEGAVRSMADRMNLDLSGSLSNASNGTLGLITVMTAAKDKFIDAAPATATTAAALNAFSFDAKSAENALSGLTETYDLFTGRVVNGAISANELRIQMLNLASGELLATDATGKHTASLDGSTVAGLQNQNMILGLVQQIQKNAQEQFNATVATQGMDAATGTYTSTLNAGIEALRMAALQSGMTAGQFDVLAAAINLTPDTKEIKVSAPGAVQATNEINRARLELMLLPNEKKIIITTVAQTYGLSAEEYTAQKNHYAGSPAAAHYATGGQISGPGGPTSDSIPIMASNGEWIINAGSAQKYGRNALAAINTGRARIIVPKGYASGGPVQAARARTAVPAGAAGSGTTGAIAQIASGATTLADVYRDTTQGVIGTARALREVVPRMWRADQQSSALAAATGGADWSMGRLRDTLVDTTGRVDGQTAGLFALGVRMADMAVTRYPAITQATDLQTAAQVAETAAQTLHTTGLVELATQMVQASGVQLPALTTATGAQTTATDLNTASTDLGTTAANTWTTALGLATDATGLATTSTDLHTTATRLSTAAVDLGTAATNLLTTAVGLATTATNTATTATGEQTTATNTASTATTAFSGTVRTATTDLGANAGAATTAAAAVRDYAAALNSVPKNVTSTVTTNYVTNAAPAGGAGMATGGRIAGAGTTTSDSIPIMASRDEYVIRAAAAQRYGYRAMDAINSGSARVLVGGMAAAGYATGGRVGHYAQGGMIRGSAVPVAAGSTSTTTFVANVTVNGGGDAGATAVVVRREVDAAFGQLARRIGARPGRGRG